MNSTFSGKRKGFRPELSGTALALASLLSVPAGAADLSELALEDLLRRGEATGKAKPEEFRRYGSARKLYNFNIDNASAY